MREGSKATPQPNIPVFLKMLPGGEVVERAEGEYRVLWLPYEQTRGQVQLGGAFRAAELRILADMLDSAARHSPVPEDPATVHAMAQASGVHVGLSPLQAGKTACSLRYSDGKDSRDAP